MTVDLFTPHPPKETRRPFSSIARPDGAPAHWTITSDRAAFVADHWDTGRATLCTRTSTCELCNELGKPRRTVWVSAIRWLDREHVMLALTLNAWHLLLGEGILHDQCRGVTIETWRRGGAANTTLNARVSAQAHGQKRLPASLNLAEEIARLYAR